MYKSIFRMMFTALLLLASATLPAQEGAVSTKVYTVGLRKIL